MWRTLLLRHRPHRVVGVLAVAGTIVMSACGGEPSAPIRSTDLTPSIDGAASPSYPRSWEMTLDRASREAKFELIVPNTSLANASSLDAVYLFPGGGAVAMDFPPPDPNAPVRQIYLEVWESPWSDGDPEQALRDAAEIDAADKELVTLDGVMALNVHPNAAADEQHANPAFLRFELGGIDVQISGGDDSDALIEIARSMIASQAA